MKNIKQFANNTLYETYINSSEVIYPNVSVVNKGEHVYYNPEEPPHDYSKDYLTIVMLENGSIETFYEGVFFSSDNGQTWHEGSITGLSTNDKVLIKGDVHNGTSSDAGFLSITGLCNVEGNIMSVYDSENFRTRTTFDNDGEGLSVFGGCTGLTSAENLVLPATALTENCYLAMFFSCTSLTTPPKILPATTLNSSCYSRMFKGCTSLTTAPELPATTLAESCYQGMFWGCSNLTTAPELSATTLAESCYQGMFNACTNLNYIKCLATDISEYGCTASWVSDVASTGTFVKNPSMTEWLIDDSSGIPSGWDVEDAE